MSFCASVRSQGMGDADQGDQYPRFVHPYRLLTGETGHDVAPPPTLLPVYGPAGHPTAPPPSPLPATPPPTTEPPSPPPIYPAPQDPPAPPAPVPPSLEPPSPQPSAPTPSPPATAPSPTAPTPPPSYGPSPNVPSSPQPPQPPVTPPPAPESPPPPPPGAWSPPPPGTNRLPPTDVGLVTISASTGGEIPATGGIGLVKIRAVFGSGSNESWSFICGDTWAGWNAAAANTACRQAGFAGGGEPLRVWRGGAMLPMLLGRLSCDGSETTVSTCNVTGAPEQLIDSWQLGVSGAEAAGACGMLAGVRCRTGPAATATVILRIASSPAPSGTNLTTGSYTGTVVRLEASVGNGPFGAVCLDGGFDNASAVVACKSLAKGFGSGVVYPDGAAKLDLGSGPSVVESTIADAQGSFLGTMSSVRCSGREANITGCPSWRANVGTAFIPCRAAAWVMCA